MSPLVRHRFDMAGAQSHGFATPQLQTESTMGRPVCAVARPIASLIAW
ncbi:hypothetical protein GCM10007977_099340 [Dactylosporangium sucinum]|uniref:Uncharacterized protein n=1 Tax=Dactylosporangium sucinum TaxID=1424081 RepID=A0A917X6V3_9ACTN|nr:hypothetical protein GCM10007977_099340 [Dactylosporangium sucinum]